MLWAELMLGRCRGGRVADGVGEVDKRELEPVLALGAHAEVLQHEPDAERVGEIVQLERRGHERPDEIARVGRSSRCMGNG